MMHNIWNYILDKMCITDENLKNNIKNNIQSGIAGPLQFSFHVACFTRRGVRKFRFVPFGGSGKFNDKVLLHKSRRDKLKFQDASKQKMKFKDFIYSTLPRKNKKNRRKPRGDHVTVLKEWTRSHGSDHDLGVIPIQHNKCLVTEDFQYKESELEHCNLSYLKHNLQQNDVSNNVMRNRSVHFSRSISEGNTTEYCNSNLDIIQTNKDVHFSRESPLEETCDSNYNTIPRIRTRIKTNPWLPSPKTSPLSSGTTSPMTSSTCSTGAQEHSRAFDLQRSSFSSYSDDPFSLTNSCSESGFSSSTLTAENPITGPPAINNAYIDDNCKGNCTFLPKQESMDSSLSEYDSIMQSSFQSDTTDQISEQPTMTNNNGNAEYRSPFQSTYENDFEEQVERNSFEIVGSRDDVFGDMYCCDNECIDMETTPDDVTTQDYLYTEERPVNGTSCYGDAALSFVADGVLDISRGEHSQELLETDKAIQCDEYSPKECFYDLDDIDFIDSDPIVETENLNCDDPIFHKASDSIFHNENDNLKTKSGLSEERQFQNGSRNSNTKVDKICGSLQDKVRKLKEDKEIVDEIVKKAKEEERLRKQELIRIQKQTTLARKEILLHTLVELRSQLEDQTNRLQSAYEHIIAFQYQNALKRRHSDTN